MQNLAKTAGQLTAAGDFNVNAARPRQPHNGFIRVIMGLDLLHLHPASFLPPWMLHSALTMTDSASACPFAFHHVVP